MQVRYIGPSDPDNLAGPLLSQEICEVVGAAKIDGAHVLIRCRSRVISSNVRLSDLELMPALPTRWAERVESTLSKLVSIHNDKSAVTRWSDIASEFVVQYVGWAQCWTNSLRLDHVSRTICHGWHHPEIVQMALVLF